MASFRPRTGDERTAGSGVDMPAVGRWLRAPVDSLRARARISMPLIGLSLALMLGGIAGGVLLSTRWQAQPTANTTGSPITRQSEREIVEGTIKRLEAEQADLKGQIAGLRAELNTFQSDESRRRSAQALQDASKQVEAQRMASGLTALEGPGIVITLDDSTAKSVPPNEDPAKYIIHDYDLRDVLNALWLGGAEAISLNGERIVGSTSLYCVGTTVICNATRLSPPYEIRAIGDPAALSAALKGSAQMEKLNQRAEIYDLPLKVDERDRVDVPAYNGSFAFKFAQPEGASKP